MTLDEAIKHCEEVADGFEETAQEIAMQDENGVYQPQVSRYQDIASSQRQLAEWLRELKFYKDRQYLINKSWQELIRYKEGIEKIKMRSQAYRERGETILASGMEQALDILKEVNVDEI